MLQVGSVFDYQGSLFEAEKSLNDIALELGAHKDFTCPGIEDYCGMSCFKHGAAFDKMLGYYSIFVNVFMCFHYNGIASTKDDAVSLCVFFGFMCNGTTSLAGVWQSCYDVGIGACLQWMGKKNHSTKLFDLLLKLFHARFQGNDKTTNSGMQCVYVAYYQKRTYSCLLLHLDLDQRN